MTGEYPQHLKPSKHLKKIQIQGYKSIKTLDLPMNTISILIGANGAGKSNFISIFSLLNALPQGKFQTYIKRHGGASNLLHFGSKHTQHLELDIEVGLNGYHAKLTPELNDDKFIFSEEFCTFDRTSLEQFHIHGKNGESGLFEGDADSPDVREHTREYLKQCLVYHFHDTSDTAGFKKTTRLTDNDFLYTDARNIAALLYRLKTSGCEDFLKSYQNIIEAVRTIAPFFHDFYLEPQGDKNDSTILLKWIHLNSDESFSAQQLSDGTARFICMATLFLQPHELRPATIILDEPELGLHPVAIEVLADIIKSVAKKTQIICSTQSIEFANCFEPKDFIVVNQVDDISTFLKPNEDELKDWLSYYKMGEIWNKNLIGGRPAW